MLRCVIEVESRDMIWSKTIIDTSHRYISISNCIIWYDFNQLKKVIVISVNESFFLPSLQLINKLINY